jgi:hypothetical protein
MQQTAVTRGLLHAIGCEPGAKKVVAVRCGEAGPSDDVRDLGRSPLGRGDPEGDRPTLANKKCRAARS